MRHTLLGSTGLRVSSVALGAGTFGAGAALGSDEAASRAVFDYYVERGGSFIDTANSYSGGVSEEMVGRFIAGRRERFVIATKYSNPVDDTNINSGGNGRKALMRSLEASLRRLGTDYVDLYWAHLWDGLTPIDELLRAFDDVVRQGKVLHIGLSNFPAWLVARGDALAEAARWTRPAALQIEYNLVQRDAERELLPMAEQLGMGILAWAPLAGGALTGKYLEQGQKGRLSGAAFGTYGQYQNERTNEIARAVVEGARELGCAPGTLAIAWLSARSPRMVPILGARTVEQLAPTLEGVTLEVPPGLLRRLDEVSAPDLGYPHTFLGGNSQILAKLQANLDPRLRRR
ncbi:aldo/keto reductase [Melittangium boletus]|uniref:aldo/keto reductase n=1 Tax=Melittangium boletus TaxID=83453 RepID=UPI003DA23CCD